MARSIGQYLYDLLPRPLRIGGAGGVVTEIRRIATVIGDALEEAQTAVMTAALARHPRSAGEGCLELIGFERMMPQLPGETLASYRERLRSAFALWQEGGTDPGLIRAMKLLGFQSPSVHHHRDDVIYLDGSHDFDGTWLLNPYTWSEFSLMLDLLDVPFDSEFLTRIRSLVRTLKAAHAVLRELRLQGPALEDEFGTVDDELVVDIGPLMEDAWPWGGHRLDGTWDLDGTVLLETEDDVLSVSVA